MDETREEDLVKETSIGRVNSFSSYERYWHIFLFPSEVSLLSDFTYSQYQIFALVQKYYEIYIHMQLISV